MRFFSRNPRPDRNQKANISALEKKPDEAKAGLCGLAEDGLDPARMGRRGEAALKCRRIKALPPPKRRRQPVGRTTNQEILKEGIR